MLNGNVISILLLAVNGLLGLVVLLIGLILKMHRDSDTEQHARQDKEIDQLRQRGHDLGNRVAELLTRMRWADEDKGKAEKDSDGNR